MSTYPSRQPIRYAQGKLSCAATAVQSGETQGEGEIVWRLSCLYFH
jgi:hypothetical protein